MLLKRDKQKVFSKIQKQKEVLLLVKRQIGRALEDLSLKTCPKDTLVIEIDENNKKIYYEIQKFFRELKDFWDFI